MASVKSGGPKSPAGKMKASKNAVTHGLTASFAHGALEVANVKKYVDELVAYYKPKSPLELLQIERIALCRSKLSRLYEVEQASLDLVINDMSTNPMLILERMHGFSDWSRRIAVHLIDGHKEIFSLGLTEKTLKAINDELNRSTIAIETESVLIQEFPILMRFLKEIWKVRGKGEFSADRCLGWTSKNIVPIEHLVRGRTDKPLPPFEAALMNIKIHEEIQEIPTVSARPKDNPLGFYLSVKEDLRFFQSLWDAFDGAKEMVVRYAVARGLMLKSVTISADDSDRLMRYQTALERRLSSAIGELLALQNRRDNT